MNLNAGRPKALMIAFGIALLSACGGKLVSTPASNGPSGDSQKNSEIERALNNSQAVCDGDACHSSVGMILSKTGLDVKPCTGYLVSSDQIATLASCLPQDLRRNGANCDGRIFTYFPQTTQYASDSVKCSNVRIVSPLDRFGKAQNFAVLQLEHSTKRAPFFHKKTGFRPQDTFTQFQISTLYNGKQFVGFFKKNTCNPLMNSLAAPDFTQPISKNFVVSGCDLQVGGEGGPITTDSEHIVGITETTLDPTTESERLSNLGFRFIYETQDSVSRGINISCLKINDEDKLSPRCNEVMPESSLPNLIPMSLELRNAIIQKMRAYALAMDLRYAWDITPMNASSEEAERLDQGVHQTPTTHLFFSIPRCIGNIVALSKELARKVKEKEDMKIAINLPVFRVQIGLDSFYRPSSKIDEVVHLSRVDFQYSPLELLGAGSDAAALSLVKDTQTVFKSSLLRSCPL